MASYRITRTETDPDVKIFVIGRLGQEITRLTEHVVSVDVDEGRPSPPSLVARHRVTGETSVQATVTEL
jgi:hypothetical protein